MEEWNSEPRFVLRCRSAIFVSSSRREPIRESSRLLLLPLPLHEADFFYLFLLSQSMASTAETYFGGSSEGPVFGNGRPSQSFNSTTQSSYGPNFQASAAAAPSRQDHVPLLELPAPLGPRTSGQDSSSQEDDDVGSYSRNAPMERSMTSSTAGFGSSNESYNSNGPFQDRYQQPQQHQQQQPYYNSSPSAEDHSPDPNAGYSPTTALRSPIDSDYDEGGTGAGSSSRLSHQGGGGGGVSLVDNGFLPPQQTAERVRRVARNAQRRTSGNLGGGPSSPVSSRPGASSPVSSRASHPTGQAPAGGYARFDRSHQ